MSTFESPSQRNGVSEDVLIILPVRNLVLFPGVVLPVAIGSKRAHAAAQEAVRTQRRVGLLLNRAMSGEPDPDKLHRVGTVASIVRFVTAGDGTHHLIAQGEQRFTVLDFVSRDPFLVARIEPHGDAVASDPRESRRAASPCASGPSRRCSCCRRRRPSSPMRSAASSRVAALADIVASFMDLKTRRQAGDPCDLRLRDAPRPRSRPAQPAHRGAQGVPPDRRAHARGLRRAAEGGGAARAAAPDPEGARRDGRGGGEEIDEPRRKRSRTPRMPPEAEEQAQRELARLERMPEGAAEYSMTRNYLDWLIAMPWSKIDPEQLDIERARAILDEDHLRAREGQAAHPRVPRGAQAEPRGTQPDPVLRRSARASARPRWARASRRRSA